MIFSLESLTQIGGHKMRKLFSLMLLGVLTAQNLPIGESRPPVPKKEFNLFFNDLPSVGLTHGTIKVEFIVDEKGSVDKAGILDSFNIAYNDVILDKIKQTQYFPAIQNGRPVRVRYQLPIKFQ